MHVFEKLTVVHKDQVAYPGTDRVRNCPTWLVDVPFIYERRVFVHTVESERSLCHDLPQQYCKPSAADVTARSSLTGQGTRR